MCLFVRARQDEMGRRTQPGIGGITSGRRYPKTLGGANCDKRHGHYGIGLSTRTGLLPAGSYGGRLYCMRLTGGCMRFMDSGGIGDGVKEKG